MNPVTHFALGWGVATVAPLQRRDRALVTLAGVAPDLDGLGIVAEKLTADSERTLYWWSEYHHVLGHNLLFGLCVGGAVLALGRRRLRAAGLALASFHLHLLCDLAGARGPDGCSWPIRYLFPFSEHGWSWQGQWGFNAWPNFLITGLALAWMFRVAALRGHSPLAIVSRRADRAFVETVRSRLGGSGR